MSKWDSKLNAKTGIDLAFIARYSTLFNHRFGIHGEQVIGRNGKVRYRNNLPGSVDIFMLRKALYGERTFASYGCTRNGRSKWTLFDLDIPRSTRKEIEETKDNNLREKLQNHAWQKIYLMTDNIMAEIKHLGLTPIPIFSGGKGIHIYILFNKSVKTNHAVNLGLLIKWLTHQTQEASDLAGIINYMEIENYPCQSDLKALKTGGIPHLVKLPLVKHLGTDKYSRFLDPANPRIDQPLPISHLWNLKPNSHKIAIDAIQSFEGELEEAIAHSRLHKVEAEPTNRPTAETPFRINIAEGPQKVVERCTAMKQLVKKAMNQHHLNHEERLFILFNLLAFGSDGIQAAHDIIKYTSDYDFTKTQYFIDHAKEKKYKPYFCENTQGKGICPLSDACNAVGHYRTPLGVVTGFDAENRALIQPVLGELKPAFETGTVDEIRIELSEKLHLYLRESPEKTLLIQTDPGVGKTVTTAKNLSNLPDDLKHYKKIFWAAQRHDMFEEIAKHIPKLKQILPKIGEDENFPHSTITKQGLCDVEEKRTLIQLIREKGWAEIETEKVCINCPVGPKYCEYFKQWKHKGSFFAPQQHLITSRIQENKINCDVIVIDENPASVFDSEIIVTHDDIDDMAELIKIKKFACNDLMNKLLNCLRRTITSYKKLTQGYEIIKKWDDKIRLLYSEDDKQGEIIKNESVEKTKNGLHHFINEINDSRFWVDYMAFIELANPDDLPKNWLGPLFKTVQQQKLVFDLEHNSRLYVKKQKGHMVLGLLDSKIFNNTDTPIICLDATADLPVYKKLLDRQIIHIYRKIKMINPIYQLTDGEYPMQSIVSNNEKSRPTRMKLLRFTKAIIEKGKNTLVVATMQFHNKHLVKYLKNARPTKKYVTAYYRNLSGSNEYEDCDQVVLIGVANPNIEEMHIKEQARRLHENYLSNKTTRKFQQYGDGKQKRKTRFYDDERMNNPLRQCREYEMIQAINRIRPIIYPHKKIWILSAIPLSLPSPNYTELNGDELAIMLGLKLQTKSKQPPPAYRKLKKAINELRRNEHKSFTTKQLADSAKINQRTAQRYAQQLCKDISYLTIKKNHFKIHDNFRND